MNTIIYTCITNGYDTLKEIETSHRAICFTNMDLVSNTWEIVKIKDELKLNRKIKICPHLFLPDHSRSVWIDGGANPDNIDLIIKDKYGFWCMKHPRRTCAYAEGLYCIEINKDTEENILPQLNKYLLDEFPQNNGLICGGLLIRDNSIINRELGEHWWQEVSMHSTRDQISFPYVAWKLKFTYNTIPFIENCFVNKHQIIIAKLGKILDQKIFTIESCLILISKDGACVNYLLSLLRKISDLIINWEPFHYKYGSLVNLSSLGEQNKMSVETEMPESTIIEKTLLLKHRNDWTLKYANHASVTNGKFILSKISEGKLILPWIVRKISFHHVPVVIVRHPLTSITTALGKSFDDLRELPESEILENYSNTKISVFLSTLKSPIEIEVAKWCIDNKVLLNEEKKNDWSVVYYEHILLNPVIEYNKLFMLLNLAGNPITENTIQAGESRRIANEKKEILNWEGKIGLLATDERNNIQAILDYFAVKTYSVHAAQPFLD